MPVIYLCPTGTYSSLIAANLHLGYINSNASLTDLLNIPYLGQYPQSIGNFLYIGKNKKDHIYTLGIGNEPELIIKSAHDLLRITGYPKDTLTFIDVSKYTPKYIQWYNTYFPWKKKRHIAKMLLGKLPLLQKEIKER